MQTSENSIIEPGKLVHIVFLFAVKYKFMTVWLNTIINSSTLSGLFYHFKSITNCKDFLRSLNGESGRASHLVYKFDKKIARCNNSQIQILNLFEFPHVLAGYTSKAKLQMTY